MNEKGTNFCSFSVRPEPTTLTLRTIFLVWEVVAREEDGEENRKEAEEKVKQGKLYKCDDRLSNMFLSAVSDYLIYQVFFYLVKWNMASSIGKTYTINRGDVSHLLTI